MSTPTDQFARLSIESADAPMPPSEEQVRHRAAQLQDILSSFEVNTLPVEFQASIFENITGKRSPRERPPQTEWTIPGNLNGTLLQWGAYNEQAWRVLSQIQPSDSRARQFAEKLRRRFRTCFDNYDALEPSSSAAMIREKVHEIAADLTLLSTAMYEEQRSRQAGESNTLGAALEALTSLCERTRVIIPAGVTEPSRRSSRRTASLGDTSISLFAVVIRQPSTNSDNEPFLLEALELCSSASLKAHLRELIYIDGLLHRNGAGDEYIRRFEALQQKANEETEGVSEISEVPGSSGGNGRSRGLEANPRPGSKRPPHPPADTTPKRGKTSGLK